MAASSGTPTGCSGASEMADWPLFGGAQLFETYLERTATSDGTPITVASTNTKGSWITVVDPLPYDVQGVIVNVRQSVAGSPSCLVDIGVGAAGSEVVVIPDLMFSSRLGHPSAQWIPMAFPSGARMAVRCQCTSTTNIPQITVTTIAATDASGPGYQKMVAYGVTAASSDGTVIDPGGTANTKGSWTQITAATTFAISMLYIAFAAGADSALADGTWLVDLGIGAGGSEIVLIPDILVGAQLASDLIAPQLLGPIPVHVPIGTRLSMRSACSHNAVGDRLFETVVYGLG